MTPEEARDEIRAAIAHYDARGECWLALVTFLGIQALFGSWSGLVESVRRPYNGGRKTTA